MAQANQGGINFLNELRLRGLQCNRWRGTRFFKEAAFDEVSAAEQKKALMEEKARKNAEVLG